MDDTICRQPAFGNRRSEDRFNVELPCSMRVSLASTREMRAAAAITDISANGIGLLSSVQIAPGTPITIEYAGFFIFATVRNCTRDGGANRIGVHAQQALATAASAFIAVEMRTLGHKRSHSDSAGAVFPLMS
jgi:hypothetical protein